MDCDCIFTVFLNFHPNRFCFTLEPRELVWESVWSILHRNFVSNFNIFSTFSNYGIWFSDFSDSRPKKIGLLARGPFFHVFFCPKSSIYLQFCKFYINAGRCSTKVFPMNLPVNMALALCQTQLYKNWFNCKRGIGKNICFSLHFSIAYWIQPD